MLSLIEKAKQIRSSINVERLKVNGISRPRLSYEFIPSYPQPFLLEPIDSDEIYPTQKKHKVALYLHVPFCTSIKTNQGNKSCLYCSYYKEQKPTPKKISSYLKAVKTELDLLLSNTQGIEISSILIGGGTPTFLSTSHLEELVDHLLKKLSPSERTQITIESSPETLSEKKLEKLASMGVNRLNIGVQSFDDASLRHLRRRHDSNLAKYWLKNAKNYFSHVNTDLMFGLPGQNPPKFEEDLEKIGMLRPESLCVYQLRITNPDCVDLFKKSPELFPTEEDCLLMNIMQIESLQERGYILNPTPYFSLSENLQFQDVLNKWKRQGEILGIGPSAYSFINGTFYYNLRSLDKYVEALEQKQLPIWMGKRLSKEELIARKICLGIKNTEGISIEEVNSGFGINIFYFYREETDKLQKCGLIEVEKGKLRLTYQGILYADEVSREFFTGQDKERLAKINLKYGCYFRD